MDRECVSVELCHPPTYTDPLLLLSRFEKKENEGEEEAYRREEWVKVQYFQFTNQPCFSPMHFIFWCSNMLLSWHVAKLWAII